jgi:hypothetical protein
MISVFAITGSSSLMFVRPLLNKAGLEGSMVEGPWSYRIVSILTVSPVYAGMLLTLGTLAGRHTFFANMSRKTINRFLPGKLKERSFCPRAKNATAS